MASKTSKQTRKPRAEDHGVPAAYLGPNGRFRPGMDARLKSDLIATVLGLDTSKALATFTKPKAKAMLTARGWDGFLARKREILAAAEAKAKAS